MTRKEIMDNIEKLIGDQFEDKELFDSVVSQLSKRELEFFVKEMRTSFVLKKTTADELYKIVDFYKEITKKNNDLIDTLLDINKIDEIIIKSLLASCLGLANLWFNKIIPNYFPYTFSIVFVASGTLYAIALYDLYKYWRKKK